MSSAFALGSSSTFRFVRDERLQRTAKILESIQPLFNYIKAGGVAEPYRAIVAEGSSRHYGNIGFAQQTIGEILRSESKLANVYQHVKRALWLDGSHIGDLRETVKHIVTTHIEFLAHISERLLIAFKSGKRTVLRKGRRI